MKKRMTNAEAILYLRKKSGWSQQRAAEELGLANRQTVWRRENGFDTSVRKEHVLAMIQVTGIEITGDDNSWKVTDG